MINLCKLVYDNDTSCVALNSCNNALIEREEDDDDDDLKVMKKRWMTGGQRS